MANTASRLSANGSLTISGTFDEVTFNANNSSISKNIFAYSQNFTKGLPYWNFNSITPTISSISAPDGTTTSTLLTATTLYPLVSQFYLGYLGNGFNEDEVWTYSIFVKYINQQYFTLVTESFSGPPNLNVAVRFDLINGTFSGLGAAGISAGIINYGNGWWRVYCTIKIPKGTLQWQPQFRIGSYDATNYTGSQVLIWGAQLEKNSAPTVYVPTGSPKNILLSTENNSNVYNWYNENVIISPKSTIDPNGNYLGQLISSTINGGNNTCLTNQQITNLDTNTNYTYSIYLKQGTSPTTFVNFYNNSPFSEIGAIITWPTIQNNNPTITYYGGGTRLASTFTAVNNGWWRVSLSMNTGSSTSVTCRVYVTTNGTTNVIGNSVYVWGAQLEYGLAATQYISNGGIYSNILPASNSASKFDFTNNVASLYIKGEYNEVDYNPNSGFKKNLINQSNFASGWNYPTPYSVLTPNSGIAPNGTSTAALVAFTIGGSQYVYQNMTWTMGNTYTMSVYVKPISTTFFLVESFQQYGYVTFNLTGNGSVQGIYQSSVTITNSSISYDPNTGYYRCSATFLASTTGSNNIGFANGSAITGNGFYLWGAQVELGPLSIYAPTKANAIIANTFNQRTVNTGNTYVSGFYDEVSKTLPIEDSSLVVNLDPSYDMSYSGTGTTCYDISGNKNHATLNGNITFDTYNAAFNLNGGYISIPTSASLNTISTGVTASVWINPTQFTEGSYARIISRDSFPTQNWYIEQGGLFGNSKGYIFSYDGRTGPSGPILSINNWYNITMTSNGIFTSLYVNGNVYASVATSTFKSNTAGIGIGSDANGGSGLLCKIGAVQVYNRALTPSEILTNVNAQRTRYGI